MNQPNKSHVWNIWYKLIIHVPIVTDVSVMSKGLGGNPG